MRSQTRMAALTTALTLLGLAVGGCAGSSARDEYNYVRSVRIAPTEISAADRATVPVVATTDFREHLWAEATRPGSLSDADLGPR